MGSTPEKKLLLIDTDPGIGAYFAQPHPPFFTCQCNTLRQRRCCGICGVPRLPFTVQ